MDAQTTTTASPDGYRGWNADLDKRIVADFMARGVTASSVHLDTMGRDRSTALLNEVIPHMPTPSGRYYAAEVFPSDDKDDVFWTRPTSDRERLLNKCQAMEYRLGWSAVIYWFDK